MDIQALLDSVPTPGRGSTWPPAGQFAWRYTLVFLRERPVPRGTRRPGAERLQIRAPATPDEAPDGWA